MQILKGDRLKSVTVASILESTNSLCLVYYDNVLPFEHYHLNSNEANLFQLELYLQEFINNNIEGNKSKRQYDYFILYTNNTEEELIDLIEWLKENEIYFNCRCVLITCR